MTDKPRKRLKPGDVLELKTPKGLAYLQFVGVHPHNGDTVRVLTGTYAVRPDAFDVVVAGDSFVAFYFAKHAVKDGEASIVANCEIPADFHMPMRLINPCFPPVDGKVFVWTFDNTGDSTMEREPIEDARGLPISRLFPYKGMVRCIEIGWTPNFELERMIEQAANLPPPLELPPSPTSDAADTDEVSPLDMPHRTTHFFFFRRKKDAAAAAEALRKRGLQIADVDKTDGKWMLVAETELIPGAPETDAMHDQLERLAEEHGGQYDGWETEV